jgi:hypothetical protein
MPTENEILTASIGIEKFVPVMAEWCFLFNKLAKG